MIDVVDPWGHWPTPSLPDGRVLMARAVYPGRGTTTWVRPVAPGWSEWLLHTRNVLGRRQQNPGGAASIVVHRHDADPPMYEYRVMTPDEAREANERHPYGEAEPTDPG